MSHRVALLVPPTRSRAAKAVLLSLAITSGFASRAADLKQGDIVVGDCSVFELAHVDVATGAQYPFAIAGADQVRYLSNGDLVVADQRSADLWFVRITPATGAHRVIARLDDNDFQPPGDFIEDLNGNIVFANDAAVTRYEIGTGLTEVLSSGGLLMAPRGLALLANGDILIADSDAGSVLIFQESSGTSEWATGDLLMAPSHIALYPGGDALVYDTNRLIRIDAVTKQQSIVLDTPAIVAIDLEIDGSGNIFATLDPGRCDGDLEPTSLNRITGDTVGETILCDVPGTGDGLNGIASFDIATDGSTLLYATFAANPGAAPASALRELDLATRIETLRSATPPGGGIAFDSQGTLYVAVEGATSGVFRVDPKTGASETVASGGMLTNPVDLAVSADDGRLYVLIDNEVIRVNPITGGQTSIASDDLLGTSPSSIRRDLGGDFLVTDLFVGDLIQVDEAGAQDSVVDLGGSARPQDSADAGGGTYFVADAGSNAIVEVTPGGTTVLGGVGFFAPSQVESMLLDADGTLIVDVGGFDAPGLVRFDPSDLSETALSELPICAAGSDIEVAVVPEPVSPTGGLAVLGALLAWRVCRRSPAR